MLDSLKTVKAAWPMLSRALLSGLLFRPQCRLVDPDPDIDCAYDMVVPTADGTTMTCNVFRSRSRSEPAPVVMCAHPYDNHLILALGRTPLNGPPKQYRLIPQSGGVPEFSTLTSWESPDPNFWVPAGYTVVNLNLPGYANSIGQAELMSRRQGEDYYAAIKWVAAQDWCDGAIGLSGVSYLAISQYHAAVAAAKDGDTSPLKCISPWEGLSDLYMDLICRGGVADARFRDFWWHTEVKESLNNSHDEFIDREGALPSEILKVHPLYDAYWAEKSVDFSQVRTPMLVCMSFSDHELHTPGSDRAYREAASSHKWIYTHRTGKWTSYYSDEVKALLLDFMDHHLKGVSNRFDDLPPVRLEVRASRDVIREVRWEESWPLPNTEYNRLHLSADGLVNEQPKELGEVSYNQDGAAEFSVTFQNDTELSGHIKLRLWVEARGQSGAAAPDDMVVCCFLDKRDSLQRSVRFNGTIGSQNDMLSRGYLRVSRRALDESRSTDWLPVLQGDRIEKLHPGEVVPIDIALCPIATYFAAGESLCLIVCAKDRVHAPVFGKDTADNTGLHVLHFGGSRESHLLIPVVSSHPE